MAKGAWDDSPRITLTFLEMFGDENDDNYLFYEPIAIAADKQGNIYVLDSKNFRVQVFDGDGHHAHGHPGDIKDLGHVHEHEASAHAHPHLPDIHHRHGHED